MHHVGVLLELRVDGSLSGGALVCKGGNAPEKFELKSLKETNLGVIEALYDPSKLLL